MRRDAGLHVEFEAEAAAYQSHAHDRAESQAASVAAATRAAEQIAESFDALFDDAQSDTTTVAGTELRLERMVATDVASRSEMKDICMLQTRAWVGVSAGGRWWASGLTCTTPNNDLPSCSDY
jgi:hypothetical protein